MLQYQHAQLATPLSCSFSLLLLQCCTVINSRNDGQKWQQINLSSDRPESSFNLKNTGTHPHALFNVITCSKCPALTGTNCCVCMITSRAPAVETVYRVDQVPDRLLMRFCKKMQFGEMTELIVLQTSRQSLRNMNSLESDVLSNPILFSNWLPLPWWRSIHVEVYGVQNVFTRTHMFLGSF